MIPQSWSASYVGIPYADRGRDRLGCDCWGLVRLVYREQLGLALPSFCGAYVSAEEAAEVARLLETGRSDWTPMADLQPFDVILFRMGRFDSHVGLQVCASRVLHVRADGAAKLERTDQGPLKARFKGAFRHRAMMEKLA